VSQTNSVAKSVLSSYAEEHILHRCEMYLNSTDTQNLSLTSKNFQQDMMYPSHRRRKLIIICCKL